ncbi:MAG: integrase catalytic domain-containing protein [Mesorhizobium sp.]
MRTKIDAKIGETYVFVHDEPNRLYWLKAVTPKGKFVFFDEGGHRKTVDPVAFERMRGDGHARRVHRTGITERGLLPRHINPSVFMDPAEDAKSQGEINRRRKDARTLDEARTLYFYTKLLAESPGVTFHVPALQRFIDDNCADAEAEGLYWKPSPSALKRVIDKHGGKAEGITFAAIYDQRRKWSPRQCWDSPIVKMRNKVVKFYWSDREPPCTLTEAHAFFFATMIRLNRRRIRAGMEPYKVPVPQTVTNWIAKANSKANFARRHGPDEARRKMGARGRSTEVSRALEVVLMDNTQVDVWAVVRSPDGQIIDRVRPWLTLAVDVYSRMIVGVHLSLEPASLSSALECLKQVVRRKEQLIKRFPECPEAADCWGRVGTLIVDNGLDFAALSFRVACEYAGISLRFAPVRTPEYKGIVERTFGTLNTSLWHRLPGGIAETPQERSRLRKDPRDHAHFTVEELEHRMWGTIVPILGMSPHTQTGVAPAKRFFESIRAHGRPTVDDISSFDAILGQTKRCLLTAEGIRFDNHRFHDPVLTSELLEDMLSDAKERGQRKVGSSATVWVWALATREDCSQAIVYNTKRKEAVRLPNWDPDIRPLTSYKEASLQRAHKDAANEAYFSSDDRWLARDRERRSREVPKARKLPRKPREFSEIVPAGGLQLIDGAVIEERSVAPSVSGSRPVDVPGRMPLHERVDDLIPPKDQPRGRASSRKRKAVRAAPRGNDALPLDNIAPVRPSQFRIDDPTAFMASLESGK